MGYSTTTIRVHLFFILSSLLLSQDLHVHAGDSADERALLEFRKAIENSKVLGNWNDSIQHCHWIGISCKQGRVISLNLTNKSLQGTISPFLFNLSQLSLVDLSYNFLRGSIPVELGELSNLTYLDLSKNRLQHGIPDTFGKLSKLGFLDLSVNQLEGKLPTSIFYNCTLLYSLLLHDNSLYGRIPPQIGNLNLLKEIILRTNYLTGSIPPSLSNATSLITFDLADNNLTGQLPSDIVVRLSSLMILQISYNNLSSDEEGEDLRYFFGVIANLTNLESLGIGGIGLRSALPTTIGLLGSRLLQIYIQDNRIHGAIPSNISKLQNLTLLNLSGNLLQGTVPKELFLLPNLERAGLNNNMLHGRIPSVPNDLTTSLGLLDLSHNHLSGGIPSSISNLKRMRMLKLSENFLDESIPSSLGSMKLEHLNLSHNRLTGKLPASLSSLSTIILSFDLSHNLLEGTLPWWLSKMDKVLDIDLSSNKFDGAIPSDVGKCYSLEQLNLSHNSLQGQIPASFGNLSGLRSLDLSSNVLDGEVPDSLQQCTNLTQLNLSFNQLTGGIPRGGVFASLSFESLKGNHFCGSKGFPRCDSRKRRVIILVVSIISSIVLFLLAILCIATVRSIRRKALDVSRHSIELFSSHPRITYRELFEATGGFDQSRLIGSGGFGHVYRGVLTDGSSVAVKVLQLQDQNSCRTFNRECQVLKRIRHRNLMSIITACSLPEFKALVLPLMSKGSLEDQLHPHGDQASSQLSLAERVHICSDVAEGMAYLHHHAPVQVIHCDLKPSNILLTDDMTAIVSDFGISRLVSVGAGGTASGDSISVASATATLLHGSVGYVAPEYGYGRRASTKGDVYSFGVVVLEMITGKRPTEEMFDGGLSLVNWVKCHYGSQLENILDSSLLTEVREQIPEVKNVLEVAVMELIEVGLVCTQEAASARPTMISIADDLDKLKQYLGGDTVATFTSSHALHLLKLFDPNMANRHTIILMQTSQNRSSRTFMDFDSISHAMDGICGLYERKLKELNPTIRNITYDISDLYNFIDGLADLSALIFDHSIQAYLPYDRQWIKQRVFQHLKKLASH
ncbi:hypothetical protein Cni_G08689 [Canna indica]|uniref:non-specific serine/threonine protein kinase n=1 Tax=Canna indica TaxID=4628 RepID=A0AAQ3K3A0_9LILI|nr:hypothetical protein Cni_G08689 [Canna indica]